MCCFLSLTGHAGVPTISGRKVYTVLPPPEDYVPAGGDGSGSPTDAQPVNNASEMPGKSLYSVCVRVVQSTYTHLNPCTSIPLSGVAEEPSPKLHS